MSACQEFGPGELIRCPAPSERGTCGCPLEQVGVGCRATACVDASGLPRHPYVDKICKWCKRMVRIEVRWDERGERVA